MILSSLPGAGDTYLVLDRSLQALVQHLSRTLEKNTLLQWPVSRIEHSAAGARLYGPSGEHSSFLFFGAVLLYRRGFQWKEGCTSYISLHYPSYQSIKLFDSKKQFRLPAGNVVECRHVILTVPILMLQRERILFSPPLPAAKRAAISRVKMSNAMKVGLLAAVCCQCLSRKIGECRESLLS